MITWHASEDPPDDAEQACRILSQLLVGKSLEVPLWTEEKRAELAYNWVPVMPRSVRPGDTVRVKKNAYPENSTMAVHNGREGIVVAIRRGIVISYTGRASVGTTHGLAQLERRVPVPHLASEARR